MKKIVFLLMVLGSMFWLNAGYVSGIMQGNGEKQFIYFVDDTTIVYIYKKDNGNVLTPQMSTLFIRKYLCSNKRSIKKLYNVGIRNVVMIFPNFKSRKPIYVKTALTDCGF